MQKLTKAEEQVMQIMWKLKKGFVKDIIEQLPEPKPPYNTISSVVRILEEKEFVAHKAYGRTYEYFPVISKTAYRAFELKSLVMNYFDGSYKEMASAFADDDSLSKEELEDFIKALKNKTEDK